MAVSTCRSLRAPGECSSRNDTIGAMRALVACMAVAALGAPAHADKKRADALFEDGRRYLATHEYALACTAFEQSQEADPAIGTQLNIALCYENWGPEH